MGNQREVARSASYLRPFRALVGARGADQAMFSTMVGSCQQIPQPQASKNVASVLGAKKPTLAI